MPSRYSIFRNKQEARQFEIKVKALMGDTSPNSKGVPKFLKDHKTALRFSAFLNNAMGYKGVINPNVPTFLDNPFVAAMAVSWVKENAFLYRRGVAFQGLESEGNNILPGVAGKDYNLHPDTDFNYYFSKGMQIVRIGYLWERLQPTLNGALDEAYLGYLISCIDRAYTRGMTVLLDCHNYGRRRALGVNGAVSLIGSAETPISSLADMYTKLATRLKGRPGLFGYDIMNEPHDMLVPQTPGTYNPKRVGTDYQYVPNWKFEVDISGWDKATSTVWTRVASGSEGRVKITTTAADNFDNFTTANDWESGIDLPAGNHVVTLTGKGTFTSGNYPQLQVNSGTDKTVGHAFGPDTLATYRFVNSPADTRVTVAFTMAAAGKVWLRFQNLGGIGTYEFGKINITPGTVASAYRDFCFTGQYATSSLMYQACITAIRNAGDSKSWLLVETDGYAALHGFTKNFGANPDVWWSDPANKTMLSLHYYFDADHTGRYLTAWSQALTDKMEVEVLPAFQWCARKGIVPFIGEYGVPPGTTDSDKGYQNMLGRFLTIMDQYKAYGTYFAGGINFSSETTIQPAPKGTYTTDRPQMAILRQHLGVSL